MDELPLRTSFNSDIYLKVLDYMSNDSHVFKYFGFNGSPPNPPIIMIL